MTCLMGDDIKQCAGLLLAKSITRQKLNLSTSGKRQSKEGEKKVGWQQRLISADIYNTFPATKMVALMRKKSRAKGPTSFFRGDGFFRKCVEQEKLCHFLLLSHHFHVIKENKFDVSRGGEKRNLRSNPTLDWMHLFSADYESRRLSQKSKGVF